MKTFLPTILFIFILQFGHAQTFNATITGGYESGAFICGDGFVYAWGEGSGGEIGDNAFTDRNTPRQVRGINNVGFLTGIDYINGATGGHVLALKKDTVIWWGSYIGAGGAWQTSGYPIYMMASAGVKFYNVKDVYSGVAVSYAIKTDGTLWSWGNDAHGKLGDNNTADAHRSYPVQVVTSTGVALTNVISVAAGDNHAMALRADGTVWSWGQNSSGQLGTGNTTTSFRAVQVRNSTNTGFLTGIKQIAAIDAGGMALSTSGELWAWGDNWAGQLGVNSTTYATRNLPIRVSGIGGVGFLTNVHEMKGGNSHSIVLLNNGTVVAFGRNDLGQLGQNNVTASWLPQLVKNVANTGPLTRVARIYRGDNFNFAADSLGNLYSWGANAKGQLGIGNNTNSLLPKLLPLPASCVLQVLPVELYDFKGKARANNEVKLNWISSKEENFSHYMVQKSYDGHEFTTIGMVNGGGNSVNPLEYQYIDQHDNLYKSIYYRLEMIDKNGQSATSSVIQVSFNASIHLEVYPNPSGISQPLHLSYTSDHEDNLTYTIRTILGEEVYKEEMMIKEGFNVETLNNPITKEGVYILSISSSTQKKDIALVVH